MNIVDIAKEVLEVEVRGITGLMEKIDGEFERLAEMIYSAPGRVVIAGIGKSGLVGRKIAATLSSTGTSAMFLHPVEAMHGDLGMVTSKDVFVGLSNSGETEELNILLPSIRKIGCPIAAMTGNPRSTLARAADIVVDVGVEKEACPMGLAPTASTTALLAMGDALAVVLIHKRGFQPTDFKKFHPGGQLGQRLSRKVRDLMLSGDFIPMVPVSATMRDALSVLDRIGFGAVFLCGDDQVLDGIITDGDIRHAAALRPDAFSGPAADIMTRNPRTVSEDTPAYDALNLMEKYQITVLPVLDRHGRVTGILHLHDILGKGAFTFNGSTQ